MTNQKIKNDDLIKDMLAALKKTQQYLANDPDINFGEIKRVVDAAVIKATIARKGDRIKKVLF